jgi:hypothetical protein
MFSLHQTPPLCTGPVVLSYNVLPCQTLQWLGLMTRTSEGALLIVQTTLHDSITQAWWCLKAVSQAPKKQLVDGMYSLAGPRHTVYLGIPE